MGTSSLLHRYFERAVERYPHRVAVEGPGGRAVTYRELSDLSDRLARRLAEAGIGPGDRFGLWLNKSVDAVVAIFAVLKAGAAYVPIDPLGPPRRNAFILEDCRVRMALVDCEYEPSLRQELGSQQLPLVLLGSSGLTSSGIDNLAVPEAGLPCADSPEDLAYILYTSGSSGRPKGVMLTHTNAISFVDWCSGVFKPSPEDRFSSHAPFHFDLSILDLYVPLKHGATLVLIGEEQGKQPAGLAALIAEKRLSVWYSTPSILTLLTQYGRMEEFDYSALRLVLFAGEVFPVKHLRVLRKLLSEPRFFNLYGPTETNVCTYFEVPGRIEKDRSEPFPIGEPCSHCTARVVDESGNDMATGREGELCISGPGVMAGYWDRPERTADAFLVADDGAHWYRTGDVVREDADGNYIFVGRRDRMVKRRGYRVELGEIEAGLYLHPDVQEAAVIAETDEDVGVKIKAFLSFTKGQRPSLIELKGFCAQNLLSYMAPDTFVIQESLPKTSTNKIDYQRLAEWTSH